MIVIYDVNNIDGKPVPIRFLREIAEAASYTSNAFCHPNFGPSTSVWLVPGTEE